MKLNKENCTWMMFAGAAATAIAFGGLTGCASNCEITSAKAECADCGDGSGCEGEKGAASYLGWNHFGQDTKPAAALMAADGLGKVGEGPITVSGSITSVCVKKGCWMMIGEGENEARVTFKDYSFFVPMNSDGHSAVVIGEAVFKEYDVELLQHYAEDQGKSEAEINAITEPEQVLEIVATSVYIEGDDLDQPHQQ